MSVLHRCWWTLVQANGRRYALPIGFRQARHLRSLGTRVFYTNWADAIARENAAA